MYSIPPAFTTTHFTLNWITSVKSTKDISTDTIRRPTKSLKHVRLHSSRIQMWTLSIYCSGVVYCVWDDSYPMPSEYRCHWILVCSLQRTQWDSVHGPMMMQVRDFMRYITSTRLRRFEGVVSTRDMANMDIGDCRRRAFKPIWVQPRT